jgi:hypothetical protein
MALLSSFPSLPSSPQEARSLVLHSKGDAERHRVEAVDSHQLYKARELPASCNCPTTGVLFSPSRQKQGMGQSHTLVVQPLQQNTLVPCCHQRPAFSMEGQERERSVCTVGWVAWPLFSLCNAQPRSPPVSSYKQ